MAVSIGSCRIRTNDTKTFYEFVHSTKDILQMFKLVDLKLNNEQKLQEIYNTNFVMINRNFQNIDSMKKTLNIAIKNIRKAKVVVIEISSLKDVEYQGLTLQLDLYQSLLFDGVKHTERFKHIDKEQIKNGTKITLQTEQELFTDLDKILTNVLLKGKHIVLVPHINSEVKNKKKSIYDTRNVYIKNRQLICKVLEQIPSKYENVTYFDPMDYLPNDPNFIYQSKNGRTNCGHYTPEAEKLVHTELVSIVQKICDKLNNPEQTITQQKHYFDRIISIGQDCGVAGTLRKLTYKDYTYHFDWNVTFIEFIKECFKTKFTNFDNLFDSCEICPYGKLKINNKIYFYHEGIDTKELKKKYQRRTERLNKLLSTNNTVLFVRKAPKDTLQDMKELKIIIQNSYPNLKFKILLINNIKSVHIKDEEQDADIYHAYKHIDSFIRCKNDKYMHADNKASYRCVEEELIKFNSQKFVQPRDRYQDNLT